MKTIVRASFLAVLLLAAPALAGDENVVKGELGEKLDRTVQLTTKGGFWGAVLVAKGGEVVLAKGYGNADYASRPNGPKTFFEIASVSKMFTAAAILKLEAQGKLQTTDGLAKFFDKVPDDKKGITLQHLLTHTSGISPELGLAYDAKETRDQLVAYVLGEALTGKPGEKFEYCNVAYALLAAVVEKASGQTFENYVKEQIFVAAGMKDTGFINDADLSKERAAARLQGGEIDRSALEWDWSCGYRGMGGVVTTALDLLSFDRSLRANEVLDAETQKKQTTPALENAGCGCFVEKTFRGTRKVSHTGSVGGFSSVFARYVEDDVVIVVLSNEAGGPSEMETALSNIIFPPPTASLALTLGDKKLTKEGALILKDGGTWKAKHAGEGIVLELSSGDKTLATVTCSAASAKGLLSLLEDALEARIKDGAKEGEVASMETGIYTGNYSLDEGKLVVEKLVMRVQPRYAGTDANGERVEDPRLTLTLVDESSEFWPLMVKMNTTSAQAFVKDLEAALGGK